MADVGHLRQRLEQEKGKLAHVEAELGKAEGRLAALLEEQAEIEEAQLHAQKVAQATQNQLRYWLADMVSAGIEGIFPEDDYRFDIEFVQRRGSTEADIVLVDRHGNAIRPKDSEGGGLVNVASLLLRIACWSLSKRTRPVFFLDEPFNFLHSRSYHARVSELLSEVSSRLGIQIVMVTGEDESEEIIAGADRMFRVDRGKVAVEWTG